MKTALMQFADNAGPDQGLLCPFVGSMDAVVYVDEQILSGSDCTDTRADLDLRSSHMA